MPCAKTSQTLDRALPMESTDNLMLAAILYSSVGHGGASGYIAAMALFGVEPAVMKPTALVLNVFVASIATWHFYRAGCFDGKIFWPLALAAFFSARFSSLPAGRQRVRSPALRWLSFSSTRAPGYSTGLR